MPQSTSFGISQSMFCDLAAVSLGYARGWDTIGPGTTDELVEHGRGFIDKGNANIFYDHIKIDCENICDLCMENVPPGPGPLYSLNLNL